MGISLPGSALFYFPVFWKFKTTFVMQVIKTSEKIIVWMHRNKYTQQFLAAEMGITRQFLSRKLDDNCFTPSDLIALKRLGFE